MASVSTDPRWVAQHFVSKYYEVLLSHPHMLGRFYKDGSTSHITFMQDDTTPPHQASDLEAIQAAVNATVGGARATTKFIDAQHSVNNGILLHVSGVMLLAGVERSFEQTFFLATQENGYYVHNDLLRVYPALAPHAATSNGNYVKPPTPEVPAATTPVAAAPAPPAPAPVQAVSPAPEAVPVAAAAPAAAAPAAPAAAKAARPQQPPAAPASPAPAAPPSVPSPQPPSSWASLVKQPQQLAAAPVTPQKAPATPAAPEYPQANGSHTQAPAPVQPPQEPVASSTQPAQPATQQPAQTHHHHHGPQHCIQVRNLPQQHLEVSLLEQEFSRFGALLKRTAAVVIHNMGREGKVAYVKFEDASGVEAALQATNVTILDRQVEIRRHEGPLPSYHRTGGGPPGSQGGPGAAGGPGGRGQGGGAPYPRGPRGGGAGGRGPYGGPEGSGGGRGPGGKDRPPRRAGSGTPPPPGAGPAPGGGSRPGTGSQAPGGGGRGRGGSGNGGPGPRKEEAPVAAKE